MELTTAQFFTTFLSAVNVFYPESVDLSLKPHDAQTQEFNAEYDFIIVGAGSAGCVVANRLSEVKDWRILLIEAGGDEDAISEAPFLFTFLQNSKMDWNYTTVKQKHACLSQRGLCDYPRGYVMGGSSTINAMMYVRGHQEDYDKWARLGNDGWGYKDVLSYFIKSENMTVPSLNNSGYHGNKGYLTVGYSKYRTQLQSVFIRAGKEFGWEDGDYNGEHQERIGNIQHTINGASRNSASKAFLNPIRSRKNLHVTKNSLVSKVILDDINAKGVEFFKYGKKYRVYARKEIILSAGAINTPKLLMLSGIGPKKELTEHSIPIVKDLPVGKGLKDHMYVPLYFELHSNETINIDKWKNKKSIHKYAINKEGPLTTSGCEAVAFLNVLNSTKPSNLQLIWYSAGLGNQKINSTLITVLMVQLNPKSTGTVKLKSNKWTDPPLIDPNYFDKEYDLNVFRKGFEVVSDYMKTTTMLKSSPKFYSHFYSICPLTMNRNEYIDCIIKTYSSSIYHPVSTAKMGPLNDNSSVLTPDLFVKGFRNLRVIDASVMPTIPRGNTNAPTIMIAEKGADIIKLFYNVLKQN